MFYATEPLKKVFEKVIGFVAFSAFIKLCKYSRWTGTMYIWDTELDVHM